MSDAIVLMTVNETAERLRRTVPQLRWMIHTGQAPKSAKIAGRLYFRESDVEAFIARAFDGTAA